SPIVQPIEPFKLPVSCGAKPSIVSVMDRAARFSASSVFVRTFCGMVTRILRLTCRDLEPSDCHAAFCGELQEPTIFCGHDAANVELCAGAGIANAPLGFHLLGFGGCTNGDDHRLSTFEPRSLDGFAAA